MPLTNSTFSSGCRRRAWMRKRNPIEPWHGDVGDDDGNIRVLLQHIQPLQAVRRLVDLVADILHHRRDGFTDQCVVIHDQPNAVSGAVSSYFARSHPITSVVAATHHRTDHVVSTFQHAWPEPTKYVRDDGEERAAPK